MNTAHSGANKSALKDMDYSRKIEELVTIDEAAELINQLYEEKEDKNDVSGLIDKIKGLKRIKVSLFFPPARALLEKFSKKLEEVVGEKVLIEIEENIYRQNLKVAFFFEGKYWEG